MLSQVLTTTLCTSGTIEFVLFSLRPFHLVLIRLAADGSEARRYDQKSHSEDLFVLPSFPSRQTLTLSSVDGIDWSRKDAKRLVTCSLDMSFKVRFPHSFLSFASFHCSSPLFLFTQSWDRHDLTSPLRTVVTSAPIWRARWLPFGDGVLTLPQRSDHGLSIWGTQKSDELEAQGEKPKPVARFEGAREGVKEYVWRMRGGENLDSGAISFVRPPLVT
jgi:hypothetical protein